MGYSRAQIVLHWATVALVVPQLLLSDGISRVFAENVAAGTREFALPAVLHMASGGVILFLAMWRLALRQEAGAPAPLPGTPPWKAQAARAVHLGFYGLLILLPVTGGLAWGTGSETMGNVHGWLRWALVALIALHLVAAATGGVALLRRMWQAAP